MGLVNMHLPKDGDSLRDSPRRNPLEKQCDRAVHVTRRDITWQSLSFLLSICIFMFSCPSRRSEFRSAHPSGMDFYVW